MTAEQVESVMANHVGPHTCQKEWWDGEEECLPRQLAAFALAAPEQWMAGVDGVPSLYRADLTSQVDEGLLDAIRPRTGPLELGISWDSFRPGLFCGNCHGPVDYRWQHHPGTEWDCLPPAAEG
jgi:hypothetical protein